MADTPKYTEADKVHWEAKKLEAEAQDLLRPPVRRASFWLALIPALAAIIGIGLQYYASSLDYKKAEILREQANLETAKAEQRLDDLDKQVKAKQDELERLTAVTSELEEVRAAKDKEIAAINEALQQLKAEKIDKPAIIAKVDGSLKTLQAQQVKSDALVKQQFTLINKLGVKK